MTASVKWRLVIIGIVVLFSLFNLHPTLKWASLSESQRRELTDRWEEQGRQLREDLAWEKLSPEEKLADISDDIAALQEAYTNGELDETFWQRVKEPADVASLDADEKSAFLSLCESLLGKKKLSEATTAQLRTYFAPLRKVEKDTAFWNWVEKPRWSTLSEKDREKYRKIVLQVTGKRIARDASVFRNIKNWFRRWWEGDESQAISLGLDLRGGSYFVLEVEAEEVPGELRQILAPLQEAYAADRLDEDFWQQVENPDLAALSDEQKQEFLSVCKALTGKEIAADATDAQLDQYLAPLRKVRKELKKEFWAWVEKPAWSSLEETEKERYRRLILQITGKTIPRKTRGLSLSEAREKTEGAVHVLTERINRTGVREPIIQRQGLNKIIVQLPGVTNVARQKRLIQRQASMRWMLVDEDRLKLPQFSAKSLLNLYDNAVAELEQELRDKRTDDEDAAIEWSPTELDPKLADSLPPDTILRVYEHEERRAGGRRVKERTPLLLQSSPEEPQVVTGSEVTRAQAIRSRDTGEPEISFTLNRAGSRKFGEVTGEHSAKSKNRIPSSSGYRGWRLAILLDENVISSPQIETQISGSGVIRGDFTPEEARLLAIQLKAGALPAKLKITAENSVGPTLGADSIRKGVFAAILGLSLVVAFMAIYYFLSGLIANFALALNIVIILGVLASLRATLTLPGIAGIILTIGMAVDANVLIFERIREELAAAKKLAAAIDSGYQKAFRTILDANVTTFLTALVLFYIGSGPVRGFAVTLMIGILTSMFTAIVVTRVVFDILLKSKRFRALPMLAFLHNPKLDFVRHRKKAFIASLVLIAAGMICFGAKWSKNFGIDFSSGQSATIIFENEVTEKDLGTIRGGLSSSADIEDFNLRRFRPQGKASDTGIAVDAKMVESEGAPSLAERIAGLLPENPVVDESKDIVYPTVAERLWKQAIIAVVVAMLGMIVYISWRFEFRFALGAILAILHDVLITLGALTGLFILSRRQLNLPVVAAVLTIIGYSINDTIVVFDRIREDMRIMKGVDLKTIINASINQTLSRTLLTSLTTLLVVICLFAFGGQAINDFAFALLVGVVVGTYSSIFVASPMVLLLEKRR